MINETLHGEYRLSSLNHHRGPAPGTVWASFAPSFARTTRQLLTAIRQLRQRTRSRREVRELSGRMLEDIGLRREDVGHRLSTPVWYCD